MKTITEHYEEASGQRINLENTAIIVSSIVDNPRKETLSEILGVEAVEQHTKYLGLPTIIGKSKKQVFA